jgi:polyhydroxyalkanoate synthesis regulator phasin
MSENRKQILEMLSQGKITADEAERLMTALDSERSAGSFSNSSETGTKPKPKYLRVLVEAADKFNRHDGKPTKVNIRVPMALIRAGVKLGGLIPQEARDKANAAMREKGMDFDLNSIKPENLEAILEQLNDLQVDVDEDKAKVRIFTE